MSKLPYSLCISRSQLLHCLKVPHRLPSEPFPIFIRRIVFDGYVTQQFHLDRIRGRVWISRSFTFVCSLVNCKAGAVFVSQCRIFVASVLFNFAGIPFILIPKAIWCTHSQTNIYRSIAVPSSDVQQINQKPWNLHKRFWIYKNPKCSRNLRCSANIFVFVRGALEHVFVYVCVYAYVWCTGKIGKAHSSSLRMKENVEHTWF